MLARELTDGVLDQLAQVCSAPGNGKRREFRTVLTGSTWAAEEPARQVSASVASSRPSSPGRAFRPAGLRGARAPAGWRVLLQSTCTASSLMQTEVLVEGPALMTAFSSGRPVLAFPALPSFKRLQFRAGGTEFVEERAAHDYHCGHLLRGGEPTLRTGAALLREVSQSGQAAWEGRASRLEVGSEGRLGAAAASG